MQRPPSANALESGACHGGVAPDPASSDGSREGLSDDAGGPLSELDRAYAVATQHNPETECRRALAEHTMRKLQACTTLDAAVAYLSDFIGRVETRAVEPVLDDLEGERAARTEAQALLAQQGHELDEANGWIAVYHKVADRDAQDWSQRINLRDRADIDLHLVQVSGDDALRKRYSDLALLNRRGAYVQHLLVGRYARVLEDNDRLRADLERALNAAELLAKRPR